MPRELTQEEFNARFGMSPEQFEAANPDMVKTAPKQRRLVPKDDRLPPDRMEALDAYLNMEVPTPSTTQNEGNETKQRRIVAGNEKEYVPTRERDIGFDLEVQDFADDKADTPTEKAIVEKVRRFTDNPSFDQLMVPDDVVEQGARNIGSGIVQLPGEIPAMVDMVRIAVPSVIDAMRNEEQDMKKGFIERFGEEFMSRAFTPEGMKVIAEELDGLNQSLREARPDLNDEQIREELLRFQDSQQWFDIVTEQMSPGLRMGMQLNDWANKIVGLGKRPDEQTIVDDLEQVVGQAIVGLPASMRRMIGTKIRDMVGEKIAQSTIAKIGTKAAELATPLSLPYTPGNVAANIGVGGAMTEASRLATGAPSLINGPGEQRESVHVPPMPINEDETIGPMVELEPHDGHGINVAAQIDNELLIGGGIGLGVLFGVPAIRRQMNNQIQQQTMEAVQRLSLDAGDSLQKQATDAGIVMTPQISRAAGLIDINSPVKKGIQKFKEDSDNTSVEVADALLSSASTVNRIEAEVNAVNYGTLANHPSTLPLIEIRRAASQLPEQDFELLNKYVYAVQRKQDATLRQRTLETEMQDIDIAYQAAVARSDTRAANALKQKFDTYAAQLTDLMNDVESTRSSMQAWTRKDVDDIIKVAEANPAVMKLANMMKKVGNDLTNFLEKNGMISHEEALYRAATREFYVPLRERTRADESGIRRKAGLLYDRITKGKSEEGFYTSSYRRDVSGEGLVVNKPKEALVALQEAVLDAVRGVTANNARRDIVDLMRSLPNAEGRLLRPFEFQIGNGRTTTSMSEAQYLKIGKDQIEKNRENYIKISRNGNVEFWQFSDPNITKSLQFAPLAVVPIFNATRKAWQTMTTGLGAPWFAAKTFFWDVPIAKATSKQGRSLGLIDTYARRLSGESAFVNWAMDKVPDPTAYVSAAMAVPYQLTERALRAGGQKIASDLANSSGVFNAMSKIPGMDAVLQKTGEAMLRTFDRSAFNVYTRHLSTSLSHLMDAAKIKDDYKMDKRGTALGRGFATVVNGYKAMIESVQNSTRVAFFAENYARLEAKYNGKIPDAELKKLVQDTRNLTGDMSRTSLSPTVQRLTSVIPYGNPIIQGTRHILSSAIPPSVAKASNAVLGTNMLTDRTNKFWPQYLGGMLLPTLGALATLEEWPEASDYWYNKTPEWEQGAYIPIPNYEALLVRWETGQWPQFDPEFLNKVPVAPEFGFFNLPVIAGLRSLGVLGPASNHVPSPFVDQMKGAIGQLTNFATPPLVQAAALMGGQRLDIRGGLLGQGFTQDTRMMTHGGANADMMTHNSEISQAIYDVVGALASSAGQIAVQTFNVMDLALSDNSEFHEALDKAMETASFEVKRRFPQIDVPGLYNARERSYSFTPESEHVYKTERDLEPIIGSGRQLSVERDSKNRTENLMEQSLTPPAKINDPMLKQLGFAIHDVLNKKGPYKAAGEAYTERRVELQALEASRARWPEDAYNKKRNEIIQKQQQLKEIQSKILTDLEGQLVTGAGQLFLERYGKPLTFKNLADAVRQDVRQ